MAEDRLINDLGAVYPEAAWQLALVTSILSVLAASYVLWLYSNIPSLRSFPARLSASLSGVDLLWFGFGLFAMLVSAGDRHQKLCVVLGPMYHALSLVSIGCHVLLATNVALMVRQRPMLELESVHQRLRNVVIAVAVLPPIILMANDLGIYTLLGDGGNVYEPTPYGTCFISTRLPGLRMALQTAPAMVVAVYAIFVYANAAYAVPLFVGLTQVTSVRRRIITRGTAYVAGLLLCWLLAFAEDAVLLSNVSHDPLFQVPYGLVVAKALLFFGQGVWNGLVYLINRWARLRPELSSLYAGRALLSALAVCCSRSVVDADAYEASALIRGEPRPATKRGGYGTDASHASGSGHEEEAEDMDHAMAVFSPDRVKHGSAAVSMPKPSAAPHLPMMQRDLSFYDTGIVTSANLVQPTTPTRRGQLQPPTSSAASSALAQASPQSISEPRRALAAVDEGSALDDTADSQDSVFSTPPRRITGAALRPGVPADHEEDAAAALASSHRPPRPHGESISTSSSLFSEPSNGSVTSGVGASPSAVSDPAGSGLTHAGASGGVAAEAGAGMTRVHSYGPRLSNADTFMTTGSDEDEDDDDDFYNDHHEADLQ
jgi:hypothetical protein